MRADVKTVSVGIVIGVAAALTVLISAGCGGGGYVSPYVPCSTAARHYFVRGAEHGRPSLIALARVGARSALYAEARAGVVYVSRSRGSTWQRFGRGVQGVPCDLIGVDPQRPHIMFAANGDQLARSTDAGAHWTTLKLPGSARATNVAFAPSADRIVYAWGFAGGHGGLTAGPPPGGLFRSGDFGATWKKIGDWEPNEVAVSASAPGTLLVTTEYGLYQTTDDGAHWREARYGLPHTYHHPDYYDVVAISSAAVSHAFVDGQSDRQMGSGQYDGVFTFIIFRTTDDAVRWTPSLRLIDATDIVFAPGSSTIAYVAGDQSNATHTAATRFHLFRTTDDGEHWKAYTGRPAPAGGHESGAVTSLLVDPVDSNVLYGNTSNGQLARSLNGGQSWTLLPPPTTG
jgi:photosystem II stability/assembly factor-like uncharacterized protein